jgi:hypothetical protein
MLMINMVGCSVNYFSTMGDLDSCLPRIVNQLELDAKIWKQGLTLRCFLANTTLSQSLACLGVG